MGGIAGGPLGSSAGALGPVGALGVGRGPAAGGVGARRGLTVGVIGAEADAEIQAVADAGIHAVVVQAYWDRLQGGGAGTALNAGEVSALKGLFVSAATHGVEVVFEIAVQYAPAWAKTAVPTFVDQDGNNWSGGAGEDWRDFVWTQVGRDHVADFIARVFAALSAAEIDQIAGVRIGGGSWGEAQYPAVGAHPFRFWGFGTAPQTGTGLASDQVVCPHPGYVPFYDASPTDAETNAWVEWWLDGYSNYLLWWIDQLRTAGYSGRVHVMHPSFGLRSNWDIWSWGYQEAVAQGVDWGRQIGAYAAHDVNVWPWSTWADHLDPVDPPAVDSDKAAWRKLGELATAHGRDLYLYGENTGGQSNADMDRMFTDPDAAVAQGYNGIFWLNYDTLVDGAGDTLANLGGHANQ